MSQVSLQEEAYERLQAGGAVLMTRLRHIGDVILTLPLVQALRRQFPRAAIHYLAEATPLEVLRCHPDLDRLWVAERGTRKTLRLLRDLQQQGFVAAIDLLSNPRSALLVRCSGAPVRIGEARRLRRHLYTVQQRPTPGTSAVQQHLEAAHPLGLTDCTPTRPRLYLSAEERQRGKACLQSLAGVGRSVLMHLGATHPAKEWPHEQVLDCIRRLHRHGFTLVLSTAPNRPEPSQHVAAELGERTHLLPAMPLRELLAVIRAADAVISVDGGIVHASVALGRPTLALFGPTDPGIWFPYERFGPFRCLHAGWDCSGCDREQCPSGDCMRALAPERVEGALLDLLESARTSSALRLS